MMWMKMSTFIHRYRLSVSIMALMSACLCACMSVFLISCASSEMRQETYVKKSSLSNINRVAVVVSVNAPAVNYAKHDGNVVPFVPSVGGFVEAGLVGGAALALAAIIDGIIRSKIDLSHAAKIAEHTDFTSIEDKMAQSFVQHLKKGSFFQHVEYMPNKNQDSSHFRSIGYDAVLTLNVREITIFRTPGEYVRLDARVHGEMERLNSGEKLWDREEFVTNKEYHPLDYYKENGLREIEAILVKAGRNLAYDFVYLK
jgi:hypothetical protein